MSQRQTRWQILFVHKTVLKLTYNLILTVTLVISWTENTLHDSVCIHLDNYERKVGPGALWLTLFVYSKVPELIDTFWLIIQRKPVIFLHWFHHVVALLYCWNSFMLELTPGAWFAIMNYGAHMFMYTYYCAMSLKLQKYATPFAPFITTLQILQMVGGIVIILYTATVYARGEVFCNVDPSNLKLGLAMYAIFFYHFCALFNEKVKSYVAFFLFYCYALSLFQIFWIESYNSQNPQTICIFDIVCRNIIILTTT